MIPQTAQSCAYESTSDDGQSHRGEIHRIRLQDSEDAKHEQDRPARDTKPTTPMNNFADAQRDTLRNK